MFGAESYYDPDVVCAGDESAYWDGSKWSCKKDTAPTGPVSGTSAIVLIAAVAGMLLFLLMGKK